MPLKRPPLNYENRVVCFIDLLGFSKEIERSSQSRELIQVIHDALIDFRLSFGYEGMGKINNHDLRITQFSDSIVISFRKDANGEIAWLFIDLIHAQTSLLLHGFLSRGAIACGELIHTDKLLFGPAMVEAYRLESQAAHYPRIILDESIIELGVQNHAPHNTEKWEEEFLNNKVQRDTDGLLYIDYINESLSEFDCPEAYIEYLEHLRTLITKGLTLSGIEKFKYGWLKEKYNATCQRLKDNPSDDWVLMKAIDCLEFV